MPARMFEIGNSLREARLRQQLDFPELEQTTKIRAKYLRALEDEQFEQLPAETYVKGFLRTYAQHLGLDGQLYVDEYNSRYSSGAEVLERRVRTPRPRVRARRRERRVQSGVVWLALVAIALVTALVFVAWRYGGGSEESLPLGAAPATKAPVRERAGLLVRAAGGNSWLVVRRGSERGRLLYQGTLEKGQALRFGTGRVWLNIGSPEHVSMRLNGRPVVVGGAKPRSLIVTADDIVPAGPGT